MNTLYVAITTIIALGLGGSWLSGLKTRYERQEALEGFVFGSLVVIGLDLWTSSKAGWFQTMLATTIIVGIVIMASNHSPSSPEKESFQRGILCITITAMVLMLLNYY